MRGFDRAGGAFSRRACRFGPGGLALGFNIVLDENIPVTSQLQELARNLVCLPGRHISSDDLWDADVLLVRSVTQVNRALLSGTPVRFVGSATAGTEHINEKELSELGIGFAAAPGANARAVTEYVLTALARLNHLAGLLAGAEVGVVGHGRVGSLVASVLTGLGARVRVWDPYDRSVPPQQRAESLQAIFDCPVVSLHASLHANSPWPSQHMIDETLLAVCGRPEVLINAARGGLVTAGALETLAKTGCQLALDTWPDEPNINRHLLERAAIATPHVAGYSLEAKARATNSLVSALLIWDRTCGGSERERAREPVTAALGAPQDPSVGTLLAGAGEAGESAPADWLSRVLLAAYDIDRDDAQLRALAVPDVSSEGFDALRRHYPLRHELFGRRVRATGATAAHVHLADVLGLKLEDQA